MLTKLISNKPMNKTHSIIENQLHTVANAKYTHLQCIEYDINTAQEFADFINALEPNETFAYGRFRFDELNVTTQRKTLDNVIGINNPWIGFDGDYIINTRDENNKPLSIYLSEELLIQLDPQLEHCRHVLRHSSSNIILPTGEHHSQHKLKLWYQFKTTSQTEIDTYRDTLFKRAILAQMGTYILSPNLTSFSIYLRTIFDSAVFSPERIWFEANPTCNDGITHNSLTQPTEGLLIDPTTLTPLTQAENFAYDALQQELRSNILPEQRIKRQQVFTSYPDRKQRYEHARRGVLTTSNLPNFIPHIINNTLDDYDWDQTYPDPLDPDDGDGKAKLFLNEEDDNTYNIMLNTFAHDGAVYRVGMPLEDLPEAANNYSVPDKPPAKSPLSPREKTRAFKLLKKLLHLTVITDSGDIDYVADHFSYLASKPTLKEQIRKRAISPSTEAMKQLDPLAGYAVFKRKSVPLIRFDKDEGMIFVERSGMAAVLDNAAPGITGQELLSDWLSNEERATVDAFGLYEEDTPSKLNLWAGFNTRLSPLTYEQLTTEIDPFLYHVNLVTNGDVRATNYLLDWLADMIQNPLRPGTRTAIAIKGEKRIGKSIFTKHIGSFFHPINHALYTRADRIVGKFNAHLAPIVFAELAELTFDSGNVQTSKDALKSLITDETMSVEIKSGDTLPVINRLHFILTSNHLISVLQDVDDARWTVFEMNPKHRNDTTFWGNYIHWWNTKGKNLVFSYLHKREISKHKMMRVHITSVGVEEKIDSLYNLNAFEFFFLRNLKEDIRITPHHLYESYEIFTESQNIVKHKLTGIKFGRQLRKQNPHFELNRPYINIRRDDARKHFVSKVFHIDEFDWDNENLPDVDIKLLKETIN